MESTLSFQSRHELILRMVPRYQKASIAQKGALLDEIVATTGYARRYAMWLLNHPEEMQHVPRRRRQRTFGPEVQHALFVVWQKANQICAKRLMPYLATHIEALERERHLHLTDACRRQLLSMSAATADRLLRGPRAYGQRGLATTRAGTLLKQQIAVRTFAQWNETQPGFLEADVVASLPDTFKVKGKSQKEAEGEGQRKNSYSRTRGATQEEGSSMNRFSPLCSQWHGQVKEFFTMLHGHQKKVLALFVLGAIKAESIVVQRVAEELLEESEAKVPSIERRLQRFLSNERIEVEEVWDQFLAQVLPYWRNQRVYLILDITPFEEHAQVVSVGLLQQSRVLPLAWRVMPGQEPWEQGQWEIVAQLFERVARALGAADCTVIADRGLSCLKLIRLCQAHGWHYLLRIKQDEWCCRRLRGTFQAWQPCSQIVAQTGKQWYGTIRLWQEHEYETQLSAIWEEEQEEAWFLISDRPAGRKRIKEYRWRMRVESTFQDMKSRGWQWEASHVRQRDRLERLLLVLFLAFWWLMHLAASCIHHGRRARYDRHDRRDKGLLRLGRLYLRAIERDGHSGGLRECLLLRRRHNGWAFALRF